MNINSFRPGRVAALAFFLAGMLLQSASAQHTPCAPGEFLKNSCQMGLTGQAGQEITVPVAKVCPKSTMSWFRCS